MNTEKIVIWEVVDTTPEKVVSLSPNTIKIKRTNIQEIDVYSDDLAEDTTLSKKKRLEASYYEMCIAHGYESVEDWYVSKKFELIMKEKLTKQEEIMLKILESIAKDMWYNDSNKEFVIWTNVKKISSSQWLHR